MDFPPTFSILTCELINYIQSNDILVDDQERNIKDWESQGGIGILHTDFDSTISKLKEIYL